MAVVGSIAGNIGFPFNGPYCASKAAVARLFDALRLELAPFNISVCVLEGASFKSKLLKSIPDPGRYTMQGSLYCKAEGALSGFKKYDTSKAASSDEVAQVIVNKLCSKGGLAPRFVVGSQAWLVQLFVFLNLLVPNFIHKQFLSHFGLNQKW